MVKRDPACVLSKRRVRLPFGVPTGFSARLTNTLFEEPVRLLMGAFTCPNTTVVSTPPGNPHTTFVVVHSNYLTHYSNDEKEGDIVVSDSPAISSTSFFGFLCDGLSLPLV